MSAKAAISAGFVDFDRLLFFVTLVTFWGIVFLILWGVSGSTFPTGSSSEGISKRATFSLIFIFP